jgi:protein-L-isoaspartate(D-aspartate) O-methyltransferase
MINLEQARKEMVEYQIRRRGITNSKLLAAIEQVPRHLFIDEEQRPFAYEDGPLPIGHGQSISQPYIVAFMTDALQVKKTHTVLEIGTGCGYQAAVLSLLARRVISLEIVPELAREARKRLRHLGYDNVTVVETDGYQGWPDEAPYDRIIGTAAPKEIPETLTRQLARNGRMVLPVGAHLFNQFLLIITKDAQGRVRKRRSLAVRFVPMVKEQERE